ncbi:MAG TPA: hypothetical protein VG253_18315 [Streptosporangiaceae bacterium]|nr:hypothetical protein [Streptosporangiaceae bacterium]
MEHLVCLARLEQFVVADAEAADQFVVAGHAAKLLGEFPGGLAQFEQDFLADLRTWTCHRLSRKCRLISPLTHGFA